MTSSVAFLNTVGPINELCSSADHIDSRAFSSQREMEDFLTRLISYKPGWLKFLYKLRGFVAGMMGLQHDELLHSRVTVADYDFNPGGQVEFFKSVDFETGKFWIGEAGDKHLDGYIGVVRESLEEGVNNYHVFTIVKYKHWTGPLYFNLIRPFHHLVVYFMGKYAAK